FAPRARFFRRRVCAPVAVGIVPSGYPGSTSPGLGIEDGEKVERGRRGPVPARPGPSMLATSRGWVQIPAADWAPMEVSHAPSHLVRIHQLRARQRAGEAVLRRPPPGPVVPPVPG